MNAVVNENRVKYAAQNLPLNASTKVACDKCRTQGKSDLSLSITNMGDHCVYKCHRCDMAGRIQYTPRQPAAPREERQEAVTKTEPTPEQATDGQKWLENERKIPFDKVKDFVEFGAAYFAGARKSLPCIEFVYKNESGKRVYSKFRSIEGKYFTSGKSEPGGTDTLYLTETIDFSKSYLIITEGELDALVLKSLGMNAVSLPTGANVKWLQANQNLLQKFKMVLVWFDTDAKGSTVADKIKASSPTLIRNFRYISAKKLEALHPGCKDANDIAKAIPPEALDAALKKVCNECFEKHVPSYVIQPSSLMSSLVRVRDNTYANRIPINEGALDNVMSLAPGYAGIVTGVPGHGKSTFLSWYAYKRASIYGHKTVFWSPENDPVLLMSDILGMSAGRVIQGHAGVAAMTDEQIAQYLKFVDDHFRVVEDSEEGSDIDTILNQMLGAALTMGGANIYVIDPLNMIKMPDTKDKLEAQKIVYSKISRFARENNVFVPLVAHPKKMEERESHRSTTEDDASESHADDGQLKKYKMPGMYSVSGSADFANMADIGITVYRDENKTTIMNWKARRPFLGTLGASADLVYQPTSGRFRSLGANRSPQGSYEAGEPAPF